MSDLFRWFLLALRLFARKSEVDHDDDDVHWSMCKNVKLYAWNNIFEKNYWYYFGLYLIFNWTFLGHFSHCFFYFVVIFQPWWPTFLLSIFIPLPISSTFIEKLSTALEPNYHKTKWYLQTLLPIEMNKTSKNEQTCAIRSVSFVHHQDGHVWVLA